MTKQTPTNEQVKHEIRVLYDLAAENMAKEVKTRSEMVGAIHKYISVIGNFLSEVTDAHEVMAEDLRSLSKELDDTTESLRKEVALTGMAAHIHINCLGEEYDGFTAMWIVSRVARHFCESLAKLNDESAGCLTPFEYRQFGQYLVSAI